MTDAKITVYVSTVSSNMEIKKQQQDISFKLSCKKIPYEVKDVTQDNNLQIMREKMGDPKGLAPQIFNGDTYIGDYAAFSSAVEDENMKEFLKL